jgi:hypothetical protein
VVAFHQQLEDQNTQGKGILFGEAQESFQGFALQLGWRVLQLPDRAVVDD